MRNEGRGSHLEPGKKSQNCQIGSALNSECTWGKRKTHAKKGAEYSSNNVVNTRYAVSQNVEEMGSKSRIA